MNPETPFQVGDHVMTLGGWPGVVRAVHRQGYMVYYTIEWEPIGRRCAHLNPVHTAAILKAMPLRRDALQR